MAKTIHLSGVGLHSGIACSARIRPSMIGGIVFRREDIPGHPTVSARLQNIVPGEMCTTLLCEGAAVRTVEHLLAALHVHGITDVIVDIDGPEVPVLDGSAACWSASLRQAGTTRLGPVRTLVVTQRIEVGDGARWAALEPCPDFRISIDIDFGDTLIGRSAIDIVIESSSFETEIAGARTFVLETELAALHRRGLGLGGSLDNALVVGVRGVINASGLRWQDEFVRHKALDVIGDLAILGRPLACRYVGHRPGHALTAGLVSALLNAPQAWKLVALDESVRAAA